MKGKKGENIDLEGRAGEKNISKNREEQEQQPLEAMEQEP